MNRARSLLCFSFLIFSCYCCSVLWCWSLEHRLVHAPNQTAYVLESDGTYREIPSNPTRKILKGLLNIRSLDEVSEEELAKYRRSRFPGYELTHDPYDPDDVMRAFCQQIEYLEPLWYMRRRVFLGDMMNPSIVIWYGRPLLLYRISYYQKVIVLSWLTADMSRIDEHAKYFGIHSGMTIINDGHQEDPRGYVLSDQRLLITYGSTSDASSMIKYIVVEVINGTAVFSDTVLLKQPTVWAQFHKNWVPFEYNHTVYFYKYLNPPEIVAMNNQFSHNGKVHTAYGIHRNDSSRMHKMHLPWRGDLYGTQLRGGTPAILVRGMLLSFFHVQSIVMKSAHYRKTYLMGMVAMCPHPPFNIIKTSKVPVMSYKLFYRGEWAFPRIDYVVFPSGLTLSEDGESLWLSMGHQDKYGYLLQFDVDGLLGSLYDHRDCDEDIGIISEDDVLRDAF